MTDPTTIKKQLRIAALAKRDELDVQYRIEAAMRLAESAEEIGVQPGNVVSGFWPIRSEMDIRPLMFALRATGGRLCLPAIIDRETIEFRELLRETAMIDMGFGTVGPGPEADVLQPDLMLVPLAAFDDRGHRVGYGGGYYDRAIARLKADERDLHLIGIAFDCQRIERVPDEAHDQPLDAILTESGLHATSTSYR